MKILFISSSFKNVEKNGGVMINSRNYNVLKEIYGNEVDFYEIENKISKRKVKNLLIKKSYTNLLSEDLEKIKNMIKDKKYKLIFISSSLLAYISEELKNNFTNLKIITFFHNIEINFRKDMYLSEKNCFKKILKYFLYKNYCYLEKTSVKNSDYLITLNNRDANEVKNVYKRKVDLILPTTLEDNFTGKIAKGSTEKELLFVGSNFFGNTQGLEWFLNEIYPNLSNIKLTVVGKGMGYLKEKYRYQNLNILGYVNDIEEVYSRANAVILPIISGSGMKTKTAEAMMYGKYMFATDEALVGYEKYINSKFVSICNDKRNFLEEINTYLKENNNKFNKESREHFEKYFSIYSTIKKVRIFLERLN